MGWYAFFLGPIPKLTNKAFYFEIFKYLQREEQFGECPCTSHQLKQLSVKPYFGLGKNYILFQSNQD